MARYLGDQWFEEMRAAAAAFTAETSERRVSLREIITSTPFDDVTYVMTIEDGVISISTDDDVVADVTFTQNYDTAVALHKGELTTHEAFFAGKVRVAGHLNTLLDNADLLQGIAPAFESVRTATTYE